MAIGVRGCVVLGILLSATALVPAVADDAYVAWTVVDGGIPAPLGDRPGDAQRGRDLVVDRNRGNCLACHRVPIEGEAFQGDIGPPLEGVGARLTAAQIRLRVVDERKVNPNTIMPGYYRDPGAFNRVAKAFRGKTFFTAQEVEDVVAYISTLR